MREERSRCGPRGVETEWSRVEVEDRGKDGDGRREKKNGKRNAKEKDLTAAEEVLVQVVS